MTKARYIRVSTLNGNQKTDRQDARLSKDEKAFTDRLSGSIPFSERPAGKELMDAVGRKEISHLSVSSLDRLGRNTIDIQNTLNWLTEQGVTIQVDNLGGLQSMLPDGKPNAMFKMITDVLANISQMERNSILERQEEGIKIAKAKGVYKGRAKGTVETDQQKLAKHKDIVKYLTAGKLSMREIAKQCDSSLSTVQRVKKIWDKQRESF
jgi:DNA invertase Pin-like site-specific DNA recombinase